MIGGDPNRSYPGVKGAKHEAPCEQPPEGSLHGRAHRPGFAPLSRHLNDHRDLPAPFTSVELIQYINIGRKDHSGSVSSHRRSQPRTISTGP